jgi:hypothetical protein
MFEFSFHEPRVGALDELPWALQLAIGAEDVLVSHHDLTVLTFDLVRLSIGESYKTISESVQSYLQKKTYL